MSVVFAMKIKKKRKPHAEYLHHYYTKVTIWKIKAALRKSAVKVFFMSNE